MYNTEHVCEYYKFTGRHTDEVLHELYQNDLLISFNQSEYNKKADVLNHNVNIENKGFFEKLFDFLSQK